MTRIITPLSSFDPALFALWERAASKGETIIFRAQDKGDVGTPAFQAELRRFVALRQRLESLRTALKREGDPRGEEFQSAICRVRSLPSQEDYGTFYLEPRDGRFGDLLSRAGAVVPHMSEDFLDEEEPTSDEEKP